MPQKVFIVKGDFGFEVVPADVVVNKAEDPKVTFQNLAKNDVLIEGLPQKAIEKLNPAAAPLLDYANSPTSKQKPQVTVDFSDVDDGVYTYGAIMKNLKFKAKGHSDPRIIVY
ncbi:MAG: hypothetical protein JSU96_04160 [Acidobacteriota bacterium]|nr:MAG: hypothetical protein JSU96_04160 [Acidobacteriota bacterium]